MDRFVISQSGKRKRSEMDIENESDQFSSPAKKPSRGLCQSWLKDFPWLRYMNDLMFCDVCQRHCTNSKNKFATQGSKNKRNTALRDHALSNDHQNAVKKDINRQQERLPQLVDTSCKEADEAVATIVRNAYFVAKEDLPIEKCEKINNLTRIHGGTVITKQLYDDDCAARDFIHITSSWLEEQIIAEVRASPAIGIIVDESTDLGTEEHLIVYVTYLKDGVLQTKFLKLVSLPACDASSITARIRAYLDFKGIPNDRVFGFGSDGAPVMVGKAGGVAAMLKEHVNPFLLDSHCSGHRAYLACIDTKKQSPEIRYYESIITSLYVYFQRSAKRLTTLKLWQDILESPKLKPLPISTVRWLSMTNALENVRRTLPALVSMLDGERELDVMAEGLYTGLTSYKFLYLTHFYSGGADNIAARAVPCGSAPLRHAPV